MAQTPDNFDCPHCGAEVPAGSSFCRECGASETSGWADKNAPEEFSEATGGYADDQDFDYEEFVAREFPDHANGRSLTRPWWIAVIVLLLCAALILGYVYGAA